MFSDSAKTANWSVTDLVKVSINEKSDWSVPIRSLIKFMTNTQPPEKLFWVETMILGLNPSTPEAVNGLSAVS